MQAQHPCALPWSGETMTQPGRLALQRAAGNGPQAVLPSGRGWPLFDAAASRQIEQAALAASAPQALMAAAGLSVARLTLAAVPQARRVQVWAGPGNNGGDGLVAARHLHQAGLVVAVNLLGDVGRLPADAQHALAQARQAGVHIINGLEQPWSDGQPTDALIDALLGLGTHRAPDGDIADAVLRLQQPGVPVLAVDLPTGLCGDTGRLLGRAAVVATHTLALLTLKPGLFTALGRDFAGRIWFDGLGLDTGALPASARLSGPDLLHTLLPSRSHAQHKGSFGDVLVLGGASGMGGAALLAASAALTAGAGRIYLARLDGDIAPSPGRPELMPRSLNEALAPDLLARCTVVCGCGGGHAVRAVLPAVILHAARLVLDADALNALAADADLRAALVQRGQSAAPTVLTPHPLEAARLLGSTVAAVQAQRQHSAQDLADRLRACVVLKGSGTVIAAPGRTPHINPTGNARLGSAGTGDVLAGWLGGLWSQAGSQKSFEAAAASVWLHGRAAEQGDAKTLCLPLRAADLIEAMAASVPAGA
jgi:hydroxyethylthiazole kinase-like uncharacterized protein yjeF